MMVLILSQGDRVGQNVAELVLHFGSALELMVHRRQAYVAELGELGAFWLIISLKRTATSLPE
jgi:hypothetical protein